jgi:phosphopantetheinyl transferase (holo-ACP synthase)
MGHKTNTISLDAQWPFFADDEIEAAVQVLRVGCVNYWTGDEDRLFEAEFAAFVGCKYAIALANGTAALECALKALGVGPGDEVVTPSRTFISSASCAVMLGARPVFNARIGKHVIVNMHVSVGHDVVLGDYCNLSPGSRLSGFSCLEDLVFIGSNAVLMPQTRVGRAGVVAACSLGRGQIEQNTTVCGVPGRIVRLAQSADSPREIASPHISR